MRPEPGEVTKMQSMMLELMGRERVAELRRDAERAGLARLARLVRRRPGTARHGSQASKRIPVAPGHRAGRAAA